MNGELRSGQPEESIAHGCQTARDPPGAPRELLLRLAPRRHRLRGVRVGRRLGRGARLRLFLLLGLLLLEPVDAFQSCI